MQALIRPLILADTPRSPLSPAGKGEYLNSRAPSSIPEADYLPCSNLNLSKASSFGPSACDGRLGLAGRAPLLRRSGAPRAAPAPWPASSSARR